MILTPIKGLLAADFVTLSLDRSTKALVMISALAAVLFETRQAGTYQDGLLTVAAASALGGWLAGKRWRERAVGWVLALGTLVPLIWVVATGRFYVWLLPPWVAALIAAAAPTAAASWQFPRPWRFALVAWALAVALTWPIVALRELDWMPSLLWSRPSVYSTAVHTIPTVVWIAEVAQIHLLGLLWIDWLFGVFGGTERSARDFERAIVWPSLGAAVVGGLLATYQGFFDLRFLATSLWPVLERASGALADANPSGSLGALFVGIPLGLALCAPSRGRACLLTLLAMTLALGVWATGSRTALLAALISLMAGVHLVIAGRALASHRRAAGLGAAVAVAITAAVLVWQPPAMGPVRRIASLLPDFSSATLKNVTWELWARNGYGLAAVAAIGDSPWYGVGVGTFHMLSPAYAVIATGASVPADNAQNWYRHQLAELGIVGSVGWTLWVFLFVRALACGSPAATDRARYVTAAYAVVGFGIASLLGMPGQSLQITLPFWILAFWVLRLANSGNARTKERADRRGRWEFGTAIALSAALAVMTVAAGLGSFRPPFRAARFNLGYRYGLHGRIEGVSGTTRTTAHAVEVAQAPTRWLKLTVWVEHPDADQRPVAVRVWRDHDRIIGGRFPRGVPMTRYVDVPGDNRRFVLESTVDRTFQRPGTRGPEEGLAMAWEFVNEPPAGNRGNP